jgi:hypothetical protein
MVKLFVSPTINGNAILLADKEVMLFTDVISKCSKRKKVAIEGNLYD